MYRRTKLIGSAAVIGLLWATPGWLLKREIPQVELRINELLLEAQNDRLSQVPSTLAKPWVVKDLQEMASRYGRPAAFRIDAIEGGDATGHVTRRGKRFQFRARTFGCRPIVHYSETPG